MNNRWIVGALLALALCGTAAAQSNARVDGLAGIDIISDMSALYNINPAYMMDYHDDVQATWGGPIVGIKSLAPGFDAGVIFNKALMAKTPFNTDAFAEINGLAPNPNLGPATQYIPHLLVGADLAGFQLGLEMFLEWNRFSAHSLTTGPAGEIEVTDKGNLHNPGAIFGVKMGGAELAFDAKVGAGMPRVSRARDVRTAPVGGTETTVKSNVSSKKGVLVLAGGSLTTMGFTLGADYSVQQFQLATEDGGVETPSGINTQHSIIPYVGYQAVVGEGILLVAQERSTISIQKDEPVVPLGNTKTWTETFNHNLMGGAEKQFAGALGLDSLAVRGGISWAVTTNIVRAETNDGATPATITEARAKDESTLGPALPYIGIGISKAFFTLDVVVNPTVWAGLVAGPSVAKVTATANF